MQHYMNKIVKIPKNISTYFKTLIGRQTVLKKLAAEFIPGYAQVVEARNFQYEDSILFSCNFKGSVEMEKAKRKSYCIKQEQNPIVAQFVEKFKFEAIINTEEIANDFYNPNFNCCRIQLDDIFKNQNKYFKRPEQEQNQVKLLNDSMENLSLFLLEYYKSLYSKHDIEEEYIISFQEIQEYVYQIIRKRAKSLSENIYKPIVNKLNSYLDSNKQSQPLSHLLSQIEGKQLDFQEMKINIESLYKNMLLTFNEYLKKEFPFEVTNVILIKYLQKLTDNYLEKIMMSLKPYWNFEQHGAYPVIKSKLLAYFKQQLVDKRFKGGIVEQEINQQLQYLIYSVDWINECDAAGAAMELLSELSKYHINVFQTQSQVQFKDADFSVEILNNFKYQNQEKCLAAEDWWNTNINQQMNILIIFQIYIILAQFDQFGEYTSSRRNVLIQILRVLNDGQYGYLNIQILQLCENITNQIEMQIYKEIEKSQMNPKQQAIDSVEITIENSKLQINFINTQILKQFHDRRELFCQITSEKGQQRKIYQETILKRKIENVRNVRAAEIKCQVPQKMQFEVLSKPNNNSNVVTLLISGFRTEKEDKKKYWNSYLLGESGTVIALTWKSNKYSDSGSELAKRFYPIVKGGVFTPKSIFQMAKDIYQYNPYEYANNEAVNLGRYLAYLIADHNLFGGYQLNIVAHSLGTLVVLECIKVLDELYEKNQKQYINSILLMGGVADTRKLQKRRWNSVGGLIHNIYSKNDAVLTYILRATRIYEKPCGLSKIYLGYKQVINYDYTHIVQGHDDYRNKLGTILVQTDFCNDFKFLTSGIQQQN